MSGCSVPSESPLFVLCVVYSSSETHDHSFFMRLKIMRPGGMRSQPLISFHWAGSIVATCQPMPSSAVARS
jgi:hypothetical protein